MSTYSDGKFRYICGYSFVIFCYTFYNFFFFFTISVLLYVLVALPTFTFLHRLILANFFGLPYYVLVIFGLGFHLMNHYCLSLICSQELHLVCFIFRYLT